MKFTDFFTLMYDTIGGDATPSVFFRTLFEKALEEPGESPYGLISEVHCNRILRGERGLGKSNLRFMLGKMDRASFRKYVETRPKSGQEQLRERILALEEKVDWGPRNELGRAAGNLFWDTLKWEYDNYKSPNPKPITPSLDGPVTRPTVIRLSTPDQAPWYTDYRLNVICPLWGDPDKRDTIVNAAIDVAAGAATAFLTLAPRPVLGRAERVAYAGIVLRPHRPMDLTGKKALVFSLRNQGLQRLQVFLEPRRAAVGPVVVPCYGPDRWMPVVIPMDLLCPDGAGVEKIIGVSIQAYGPNSFVSDQMLGWFSVRDLHFE